MRTIILVSVMLIIDALLYINLGIRFENLYSDLQRFAIMLLFSFAVMQDVIDFLKDK